jgi:light-independent protochlorophyllide reductase subunit B
MFREDFEFHDGAAPSHLGATSPLPAEPERPAMETLVQAASAATPAAWAPDAEKELNKIPFFVRGKARRNTERYASETGAGLITVEVLYDAKAHFGR